ncbi:DNA cytosine methyltransferase [Pectobacterium carotovorum]|uniref:DNA cytosine methyltransferase n=1 Tax=Pectobacterium carotovorum TaxID=554 RepID=UPI00057D3D3E|nr:DNA cytosine methyltransferase [Pectobacterium carotovorum]KHT18075.1 DNA methyltransferase [Pectobacterium carotovorum subsp. carotovorum]
MDAIDLFAGFGGSSAGAVMAGVRVVWAANHWPVAVECHKENHPTTIHACQDLHQADWQGVPRHDLMLASPCCQGHSRARGKSAGNPQHDASRSTAWAVVSAAEYHRPATVIVENVREFLNWSLYPAWESAMSALGYSVSPHIVDCADLSVPQSRVRLFLICTRSKSPLRLNLRCQEHVSASTFIDFDSGTWSQIVRPNRAVSTIERIENGRRQFGDRFLISYYGNTKSGRSIDRPIGTITTRDRWGVIDSDRMRMLTKHEVMAAMSFPDGYITPDSHRLTVHMAGNAVPPVAMMRVIKAVSAQA